MVLLQILSTDFKESQLLLLHLILSGVDMKIIFFILQNSQTLSLFEKLQSLRVVIYLQLIFHSFKVN